MSKSSNQSIGTLAMIAGIMSEINKRRLISHVIMRNLVDLIMEKAEAAINRWDETGDGHKNTDKITEWYGRFNAMSDKRKDSAIELISFADHLLTDLLDTLTSRKKIRNAWKIKMLSEIHADVLIVHEWLDPEWRCIPSMERAGKINDKFTGAFS